MSGPDKTKQPGAFDPKLDAVVLEDNGEISGRLVFDATEIDGESDDVKTTPVITPPRWRLFSWGGLFFAALTGLAGMLASLWLSDHVAALMARNDWIGWLTVGFLALAGLAALALALREIVGILRLRRLKRIRDDSEAALGRDDEKLARRTYRSVRALYRGRADMKWALAQMRRHNQGVLTPRELLTLIDRELAAGLDGQARAIVAASSKRVSVVTALSPMAVLDMAFVAAETFSMLRRLATLYGGRPGFIGLMRLLRRVISHIVLTGGLAVTLDLMHDALGKRLVSLLAGRLGEGFFNGSLTARLGIAAIEICRPLPFIEAQQPTVISIVKDVVGTLRKE